VEAQAGGSSITAADECKCCRVLASDEGRRSYSAHGWAMPSRQRSAPKHLARQVFMFAAKSVAVKGHQHSKSTEWQACRGQPVSRVAPLQRSESTVDFWLFVGKPQASSL
jgi:hypothetical protein